MRIVDVKASHKLYLIDKFLEVAGASLKTFGYYSKRNPDAVKNHITTLVGLDEVYLDVEELHSAAPVVYGHLDRDGYTVWLGICVAEGYTGKGYGSEMMSALLKRADDQKLTVTLGVHRTNRGAMSFYGRHGFKMSGFIEGRPDLLRMTRWRTEVADTIGSLIDKLATVNNKLFVSQDVLYEIRRMSFDDFKKYYVHNPDGAHKLWDILKKTCDLNFQRSQLVAEVDQKIVEVIKDAVEGKSLEGAVQLQHKTY